MSEVPWRALVVEDDPSWQNLLGEILADAGLAVDVAGGFEEALEKMAACPHRVAVIDLSLDSAGVRNQDGVRLLDAVRREDPACVTILLTGFATVEIAVSALTEHGAYTCLRKETYDRVQFAELVSRILGSAPPSSIAVDHLLRPPATARPEPAGSGESVGGGVLVVEDDPDWRAILTELVAETGRPVTAVSTLGQAITGLRDQKFVLAVVDLSLSSFASPRADRDGYQVLSSARAAGVPTIMISGMMSHAELERLHGEDYVLAYIEKQSFDRSQFLAVTREALAITEPPLQGGLDSLTERELEVLHLLTQGLTNRAIASALFVTTNTVKRHLKSIFAKLGVDTRSAATAYAIRHGIHERGR